MWIEGTQDNQTVRCSDGQTVRGLDDLVVFLWLPVWLSDCLTLWLSGCPPMATRLCSVGCELCFLAV